MTSLNSEIPDPHVPHKTGVTVVIPTLGRETLVRALQSVRDQTLRPDSTIVVLDEPSRSSFVSELLDENEALLVTTGGVGGATARNMGVMAATTSHVAFLDDDDSWRRDKLASQWAVALTSPGSIVFAHSAFHFSNGREETLPRVSWSNYPGPIGDYLVSRPNLRHGMGYVQSSSILLERQLANEHPWNTSLRKHQDWDFILRLANVAPLVEVPEVLVDVYQGTRSSVSATVSLRSSIDFVSQHSTQMTHTAQGDFIMCLIVRGAITEANLSLGFRWFGRAIKLRPHVAAFFVALAGGLGGLIARLRKDSSVRRRSAA